ncbi:MAG: right-handed parallel beta-helix repeat-containing protein [Spirochaetaceae bacterium]|jgi:hypothetical protein|nr:right-handed parallel beta-helix repeat-containing protein [Spirochaetaceae bacterium]
MKKVFTGIVFLAAAGAAFGTGSWAASDRVVYDGESEIIFDYSGPEGVLARVYQEGKFVGDIRTGETKRRIVEDGSHNFEVHSGVYDAAKKETVTNPQSLSLRIDARKNRSSVRVTVSAADGENLVTGLSLSGAVAIQTRPKPPPEPAAGQSPPAAEAAAATPPAPASNAKPPAAGGASYYVSAKGNNDNDGLTEATAFKTLGHAVWEASFHYDIKTITVIGTLNDASEGGDDEDEVFLINIFTDTPLLIIRGIPGAPAGRRAVLSAADAQKNCVRMRKGVFRFEHIEISGSPKTGLEVSLNAEVTLGPGSVVRNNQDGGVFVSSPKDEYRYNIKSGHLILDGGIIENNKRKFSGGGIYVMGAFTMKRGSVRNNSAISDAKGNGVGGGICINSKDTVSIEEGDISGNTAIYGGGIFITEGNVTMRGGSVSGNTATGGCGGIMVDSTNGTFTQRGGTVKGNKAPSDTRTDTWDIFRLQ